jgi:acetoin utilization protein AcuB
MDAARPLIMLMPSVSRYMTRKPFTIERTATIADARRLMQEHNVRHLPILDGGELVGVVSERDLSLFESLANFDLEPRLVEEVMIGKPFIVTGDMPLDEVVEIMGQHKYGSVVVMGRDGVEGIFTAVDACNALAKVLQEATMSTVLEGHP